MRKIALRNRHGEVARWALVDDEDFDRFGHLPWYWGGEYVQRQAVRDGRRTTIRLHREIMGLVSGDRREVDHESRDRLDNQRSNLRVVPGQAANKQNVGPRGGASGHRGVYWAEWAKKWRASVHRSTGHVHLGYFNDKQEAQRVVAEWRAANMPYSVEGSA